MMPGDLFMERRIRSLVRPILQALSHVSAQTDADATRFMALGVAADRCTVTGNLKFDAPHPDNLTSEATALRQHFGPEPIWMAASTHPGEEDIILQAHQVVLSQQPKAKLLLVPRHPNRFDTVAALCRSKTLATKRFSTNEAIDNKTQVVVGDVVGKMMWFYSAVDVVFMGGSLMPIGGHNFIEPASVGKACITGPHLHNFAKVAAMLTDAGALMQVKDAETLAAAVLSQLTNAADTEQQGLRAKGVADKNRGACQRQLAIILNA